MRLLILTFSYAPRPNARAIRWAALAEEFTRRGHQVSVITAWQPGESTDELCNGVRVFRVGSPLMERLRRRLAAGRSVVAPATDPSATPPPGRGRATGVLTALNRSLWSKLWWPDSTCVWAGPAVRKARDLLRSAPVDAVISVSPTFTAVLAGYRIAADRQRCGKWMLDLGDPFSVMEQAPPNNFRLYRGLNHWFERRAFRQADAISVTNQSTHELYAQLFPESARKITVIPPLLPATTGSRNAAGPGFFKGGATVRLVYLGTLYREIRKPDFLLQLFLEAALPGAELHFIGDTHQCHDTIAAYSARASGIVEHGLITRNDALGAIRDADVLVNLGNNTVFQLPSKLVEYAATGKRIVSISRAIQDSSAQFLQSYPRALCLHDSGGPPTPDQVTAFASFCARTDDNEIAPPILEDFLRSHRLDRIAGQYEKLLYA